MKMTLGSTIWIEHVIDTDFDRIEFHSGMTISTPFEGLQWLGALFIPQRNGFTTCCILTISVMMIDRCEYVLKRIMMHGRLFPHTDYSSYFANNCHCWCFVILHVPSFNQFIVANWIERITIGNNTNSSNKSIVCWNCSLACSIGNIPNFNLNRNRCIREWSNEA